MFENTTHLHIRPGKLDESLLILRADIVPILRRQTGLLSLALIPQPNQNQVIILSIWANRACARMVEINPLYQQEIRKLDPLLDQHERVQDRPFQKFFGLPAVSVN